MDLAQLADVVKFVGAVSEANRVQYCEAGNDDLRVHNCSSSWLAWLSSDAPTNEA